MRIIEILLPKGATDKSLSPQAIRKIDMLQRRMDSYVDKITDPGTSASGREFLKSKLRKDYDDFKTLVPECRVTEDEQSTKYEVYDRRTGKVVGGPYSTASRARTARDKKDEQYGAVRYAVRPVGGDKSILEAVHKLPLTSEDFEIVKRLMERPIPAIVAPIYIQEIIDDDELNDQFRSLEDTEPGRDVRPLIAEWFNRVMPDQMHRFGQAVADTKQKMGILSPIHGYDPHMYKGGTDTGTPQTGNNAFGMA